MAIDYWADVLTRGRVYSNAKASSQKMGWVNPGDRVHVIELFGQSWARFDKAMIGDGNELELEPRDDNYKEWWTEATVKAIADPAPEPPPGSTNPVPPPGPDPGKISFREFGEAIDTAIRFFVQVIKSS